MAGSGAILQRSVTSFRRQGSSGLVWDERFLSGELTLVDTCRKEEDDNKLVTRTDRGRSHLRRQSHSDGSVRMMKMMSQQQQSPVVKQFTNSSKTIPPPRCWLCGIFSAASHKSILKSSINNHNTNVL